MLLMSLAGWVDLFLFRRLEQSEKVSALQLLACHQDLTR